MFSVYYGSLSHIAKKSGIPRNVERQQKAALQSYANRAYQVTHRVHSFKSHSVFHATDCFMWDCSQKQTVKFINSEFGWLVCIKEGCEQTCLCFEKNTLFSEGG